MEFGFSLPVSLAGACKHPLLQAVERLRRSGLKDSKIPDDLLVLSCEEDYEVCVPFLEEGAEIYSSELLLNGIVAQKLDYDRHRLFADHVKKTLNNCIHTRQTINLKDKVLRQSLTSVQDKSNNSYNTLSGYPVVDRWKSRSNFKRLNNTYLNERAEVIKVPITVEDTGVGIPLEAQERIFMPFMQANSSTSRTYCGIGIGLSTSKQLVDFMGSEIGFVSEPGTGSTFSFIGNFAKWDLNSLETKSQQYHPAVLEFRGWRALVVDGKSIRAEVTRYHLQRLGISVDITYSVDSACSYLSSYYKPSASAYLAMTLVDKDTWKEKTGLSFHHLLTEFKPNDGKNLLELTPKTFLLATSTCSTTCNDLKSASLMDNVLTKPLRLSALISYFQDTLRIGKKRQVKRGESSTLGILLRGKQILVVDDNMVNRRVAKGALKKYGAIVTCVDSGKAALRILSPPHSFDACFMDLQMLQMDRFEATHVSVTVHTVYLIRAVFGLKHDAVWLSDFRVPYCYKMA
ncbi:hypothetical protein LguiA_016890 [Lonicera macranthoides]